MELYIVRHGDAGQPSHAEPVTDAKRDLSAEGRKETAQVAKGLHALGCQPDRIGTSPLPRARQTAEILRDELGTKSELEICNFLAPGSDAGALVRWLGGLALESVMIVGHNPDLAELASNLLTDRVSLNLTFKKSGVCLISFDGPPVAGAGCLEWLLQPKHLRALAR